MSQEVNKPVTGSNEHFAEIEVQLAKIMDLQTRLAAVSDSYHALVSESSRVSSELVGLQGTVGTLQTTVSNLQSSVTILTRQIDSLQRVNSAS